MRYLLATAAFALATMFAGYAAHAADTYTFDKTHTNITWSADHFGFSKPSGKWMDVEGTLTLDEAKPENSRVEATINLAGLITGLEKFDAHLKSKDFFETDKYPHARFVSEKVERTGEKTAKVTGQLTLHGVTKPVTLDVTVNKIGENPFSKNMVAGFHATTQIKRSDFGMSYGIPGVSDAVDIDIQTELLLKDK